MAIEPSLLPGPTGPEPGAEPIPEEAGLPGDLYPTDDEEYKKLLAWCNNAFTAADQAREPYAERWRRYYRMYRSYIEAKKGDWRSRVFVPICFWIIETITPRLVAQLPKAVCNPVGPEDVVPAQKMEMLLDWATEQSGLYSELVKSFKCALKYGTGIIKTYHRTDVRRARKMQATTVPIMGNRSTPIIDPDTGQPMLDAAGQPIVDNEEVEIGRIDSGVQSERYSYVAYDGPAAECIDIFNFWVAPEAQDIDTARYVIHRTYREVSEIKKRIEEGIYQLPPDMDYDLLADTADDPHLSRLSEIGLGSGMDNDTTRKSVEVLEFWLDDGRKIVMANRKCLLQVLENPYDHSEKPFVRIVDYLAEHEFWGIGEIEPLEGLQDLQNALVNSRVDNVRLVLNAMFAVNTQNVEDLRDLQMRPGGIIRLKGDFRPEEVLQRIDLGDVTGSAFTESQQVSDTIEKVSGVSAYQMGLDSPSLNETATGVAIIQEQGASRFGLKSKLAELMGFKRVFRHYGSILQQFTTEERLIRLAGTQIDPMTGQSTPNWGTFSPEDLQGALDYDIQSESSTQTQTMRQEQKLNLLALLGQYAQTPDPMTGQPLVPASGLRHALQMVLETMGEKDIESYLGPDQGPPMDPGLGGIPAPLPQGPPPGGPGLEMLPPMTPEQEMAALGGNAAAGTPGDAKARQRMELLAQQYDQAAGGLGGY